MALNATFTANWEQFDRSMENAKKNVVAFEVPVKNMQRELQRMVSSIDGTKMAREMSIAAAGIEKVGGVLALTEREQRKWNDSAQETIAKYHALGQTVPAEIKKVADELQKAVKASDDLKESGKKTGDSMLSFGGVAKTVGGMIAGAFAVEALIGFGKEVIALGGQIADIANRTGMSTDAVQELGYAAKSTGSSFEAIQSASSKLSDKLVEQSTGTVAALRDIGLTISELQRMRPEDAFAAVADAVGEIQNPMQQTQLAIELFGATGTELLPAMKQGFSDLRKEAHELGQVMSEDAVKGLDDLGDAWGNFITTAKNDVGELINDLVRLGKAIADAIPKGPNTFKLPEGVTQADQYGSPAGFANALRNAAEPKRKSADIALPISPEVVKAVTDYVEQLKKVRAEMAGLSESTKRQIVAGKELKQSEEDIGKAIAGQLKNRELATEVVKVYLEGLKDMESQQKKLATLSLTSDFKDTIAKARQWVKEIDGGSISIANLGAKQQEVNKQLRDAEQAMKALGMTGDPLYERIVSLANATTIWGDSFTKVKSGLDDVVMKAAQFAAAKEMLDPTTLAIMFGSLGTEMSKVKLGLPSGVGANAPNADEAFMPKKRTGRDNIDKMLGLASSGRGPLSQLTDTFRGARQAQQEFGKFGVGSQMFTGSKMNRAAAAGTAAIGIAEGAQDVWAATDKAGAGERALGGALAGAKAGAMFGPYGMAIGAAAGLVVGLVRGKPEWAKAADEVGRDFGVKISAALGKEIAKTAKELFKGDRSTAAQFHLGDIIKEGGGVNDLNFDKMTAKLRDTFSFLERGQFSKEQARKVIDENFQSFADHVLNSTHLASKGFQELFELNKRFGLESAEMRKFVEGQTSALGSSIAALAGPLADKYDGLAASIKEATKEVNKLTAEGKQGTEEYNDAVADLTILQHMQKQGAIASAEELERLGNIAVGAFNAAIAGGMGYVQAIEAMGPALDQLIGIQKNLGIETSNAALAELTSFRDRVNGNKTLVLAAEALGETMRALASIGGLNNETLAAMEVQGVQTFERLKAAGFSENQALMMMKGFLENVQEGHEQLGTPIDENTQKLIDQAKEAGILKDKTKTGTDIMERGFDKVTGAVGLLAKALGVDVPAAIQETIDRLNDIPRDIDVNVNVNANGPGLPDGSATDSNGSGDGSGLPGAAGGIYATGGRGVATWFGEAGAPELGGPVDFMGDVLSHAIARLGGGRSEGVSGPSVIHVHLETDGREFAHAVLPYMPEVLDYYGAIR